jgi:hypothetical protein
MRLKKHIIGRIGISVRRGIGRIIMGREGGGKRLGYLRLKCLLRCRSAVNCWVGGVGGGTAK